MLTPKPTINIGNFNMERKALRKELQGKQPQNGKESPFTCRHFPQLPFLNAWFFGKLQLRHFFVLISIYKKFNKTSYYITAMDQNTIFLFEVNLQEKIFSLLGFKNQN